MPLYTDFSSLLAIATILCGLIWGIGVLIIKPPRESKIIEYARSFFPILLIVCLLRSFIAEPFRIPSGSMKPTLLEGDFILVNKFAYGIRLPVLGAKIMKVGEPKRGDILVFRFPNDTSVDFIKRVVGLPGDKITYKDKTVYLNGKPLDQEYVGTSHDNEQGYTYEVKQYKEMLPGKAHMINLIPLREGVIKDEITVPEGKYFVMGDNRDSSEDSRAWGFVPEDLILGKAFFIWLSWDHGAKDIRWKRIGTVINT